MKFSFIILFSLLIITIEAAHFSRKSTLSNAANKNKKQSNSGDIQYDTSDPIVEQGFVLGDEIMTSLDKYRETEVSLKADIPRTDRMKQIAYELTLLIQEDIDKFYSHPEFLKRAKRFTADCYYSEFLVRIYDKAQFPEQVITAWANESENSKRDLQWDYDEGASYCITYSTGYLCSAAFLMLPSESNPEKTALIQKLRTM